MFDWAARDKMPKTVIKAVTRESTTFARLSLVYGVQPFLIDWSKIQQENASELVRHFKEAGIIEAGKTVLFIYGAVFKKSGFTNSLSLFKVE